ncbi:MAG TPA: hypothetical protein VMR49_00395 [Candidatus Paceibacterota bacterium]|nr:hypothetical protein [Candidatus Paceibacterota bacterium]
MKRNHYLRKVDPKSTTSNNISVHKKVEINQTPIELLSCLNSSVSKKSKKLVLNFTKLSDYKKRKVIGDIAKHTSLPLLAQLG